MWRDTKRKERWREEHLQSRLLKGTVVEPRHTTADAQRSSDQGPVGRAARAGVGDSIVHHIVLCVGGGGVVGILMGRLWRRVAEDCGGRSLIIARMTQKRQAVLPQPAAPGRSKGRSTPMILWIVFEIPTPRKSWRISATARRPSSGRSCSVVRKLAPPSDTRLDLLPWQQSRPCRSGRGDEVRREVVGIAEFAERDGAAGRYADDGGRAVGQGHAQPSLVRRVSASPRCRICKLLALETLSRSIRVSTSSPAVPSSRALHEAGSSARGGSRPVVPHQPLSHRALVHQPRRPTDSNDSRAGTDGRGAYGIYGAG